MRVIEILIKNYKSIEELSLPVDDEGGSRAFPYMGVNEAGKSSILNAVSLLNEKSPIKVDYRKDRFSSAKNEPIEVSFLFQMEKSEIREMIDLVRDEYQIKDTKVFEKVLVTVHIDINSTRTLKIGIPDDYSGDPTVKGYSYGIVDEKGEILKEDLTYSEVSQLTLGSGQKIKKTVMETEFDLDAVLGSLIAGYALPKLPRVVLWKSESKYLIPDQVTISSFVASPDSISIPLKNCFLLAGALDVKAKIDEIKDDSNERRDFAEEMSTKVTAHVKNVWKEHDVEIEFDITDTTITTSVRDKSKDGKSNRISPSQRSDGFRRMISFILNISAESTQGNLENTILLLDEPETQIHPTGQEYLRDELIKISKKNDNLVLYATHSPYMVGRDNFTRVEHVKKGMTAGGRIAKTSLEEIKEGTMSFGEINYLVLNIPTIDYHSELYGYLQARFIESAADSEEENKSHHQTYFDIKYLQAHFPDKVIWKRDNGNQDTVTIHTYIRNCIHHPEVTIKNHSTYSKDQLRKSIEELRKLKLIPTLPHGSTPKTITPTKIKVKSS